MAIIAKTRPMVTFSKTTNGSGYCDGWRRGWRKVSKKVPAKPQTGVSAASASSDPFPPTDPGNTDTWAAVAMAENTPDHHCRNSALADTPVTECTDTVPDRRSTLRLDDTDRPKGRATDTRRKTAPFGH